jgi:hypothetical protein
MILPFYAKLELLQTHQIITILRFQRIILFIKLTLILGKQDLLITQGDMILQKHKALMG